MTAGRDIHGVIKSNSTIILWHKLEQRTFFEKHSY